MVATMNTADHCRKRAAIASANAVACLNATLRSEWLVIAQEWTSFAILLDRGEGGEREARRG